MLTRRWLLLPLAAVLIASHALVLRYALQHKSLSAAMVSGDLGNEVQQYPQSNW